MLALGAGHGCVSAPALVPAAPSAKHVWLEPKGPFSTQLSAFRNDRKDLISKKGRRLEIIQNSKLPDEGYRLAFGRNIRLEAKTVVGAAWGLQALADQLDAGTLRGSSDKPDNAFRAVMIDVARRYHSPSTLRQMIRACAAGRIRFLQLHLTDDQSWMFPSRSLPGVDKNNRTDRRAYTESELKDLQKFARARGVTIIPEIDMPGHSNLLTKYRPGLFKIDGSSSWTCINFASPTVRRACKTLIGEMARLFPDAPYIHIGGDETYYPGAENNPHFAGRSPDRVLVDFIGEMCEAVLSHKKRPLVWEGFGPSEYAKKRIPKKAVIVAWAGATYPPHQLLKDGFTIINAGWDPNYVVNHYPYDSYTLVPLERLYKVNPRRFGVVHHGSATMLNKGTILGSLMCYWEGHEWNTHTTLPRRILAYGRKLWSRGESDFKQHEKWASQVLDRIKRLDHPFEVRISGSLKSNELHFEDRATITASGQGLEFGYRVDGAVPSREDIQKSINVGGSCIVTLQAFKGGQPIGEVKFLRMQKVAVVPNLALGASVTATSEDFQFPARAVTDGVATDVGSFWLGYPNPSEITVDLGSEKSVSQVDVVDFYAAGQGTQYVVSVAGAGRSWEQVADASGNKATNGPAGHRHSFPARTVRYIRVRVLGSDQFPTMMARIHEIRAFGD